MSVVQMNNSSNEQLFKCTLVQTAVVQMRIHLIDVLKVSSGETFNNNIIFGNWRISAEHKGMGCNRGGLNFVDPQ